MVQVITHHELHLVEFVFDDGYSSVSMAGFSELMRTAAQAVKGSGDYFDILADFRRYGVMPQGTSNDSIEQIEWCLANGLRKSANITTSAIMKLQIQRLSPSPRFWFFTTREEALAWLALPYEAP